MGNHHMTQMEPVPFLKLRIARRKSLSSLTLPIIIHDDFQLSLPVTTGGAFSLS